MLPEDGYIMMNQNFGDNINFAGSKPKLDEKVISAEEANIFYVFYLIIASAAINFVQSWTIEKYFESFGPTAELDEKLL